VIRAAGWRAGRIAYDVPTGIAVAMFFSKIDLENDPVRRWHRPDRHFFASGACHILAFALLDYPNLVSSPLDQARARVHR
jgi:hypothetical protein